MDYTKKIYSICTTGRPLHPLESREIEQIVLPMSAIRSQGEKHPCSRKRSKSILMHPASSTRHCAASAMQRIFLENKPLIFPCFRNTVNPDLKSHLCFQTMTEHIRNENRKAPLYPRTGIDNLTSQAAYDALRPDGTAFYNDKETELHVRCCSGH